MISRRRLGWTLLITSILVIGAFVALYILFPPITACLGPCGGNDTVVNSFSMPHNFNASSSFSVSCVTAQPSGGNWFQLWDWSGSKPYQVTSFTLETENQTFSAPLNCTVPPRGDGYLYLELSLPNLNVKAGDQFNVFYSMSDGQIFGSSGGMVWS